MTRIASLFLAFIVAVAFSACGNTKDPSQDNKNNSIQNNTVVSNTVDMPQNVEQNSPLEIELVGESKVIIRLTHESINEGLANKDESFLAAYEMYFLANENLKINFRLNRYDSILYSEDTTADGNNPLWHVDFDQVKVSVSENTASCEIQMPNICSYFRECDSFEVYYYKDVENPIRTDENLPFIGALSSCMKEIKSQQVVQLFYNDDDTAVVRINSLEALDSLKENGLLYLDFYKEGTNLQSYADLSFNITTAEVWGGVSVQLDESNYTTELFLDENGYDYNGPAVETEYGVTFLFHYKGIKSIIEAHSVYQLFCYSNDDKVIFELGSVVDAVSIMEYNIPEIPVVFPVNSKDSEFFTPDTDDYILAMMEYPAIASLDFDYGTDMGNAPIYAPYASHITSYKALALVSYDEFGVKSSKVKLVYENATEAMTAPADRLTWCYLTGSEEGYEALIAEFFEQLISPGEYYGWQYMGRYDAVKYFYDDITKGAASHEVLSYALSKEYTFDENGFFSDSASYSYDFPDFTIGHSYVYDDTATVTIYSSKQNKTNS